MEDSIMQNLKIEYIDIDKITPYKANAKIHTPEQIEQIKSSIKQFHMIDPLGVWGEQNLIIEGHGRHIACKELGYRELPCIRLDHLTEEERKAYTLAHNKLTMNTDFDFDKLDAELAELRAMELEFDMSEFGFEELETKENPYDIPESEKGSLVDQFVIPPFTILDTRQGYWNDRKRLWRDKIKDNAEARKGAKVIESNMISGFNEVSLLDPVLSEIIVKWFMPKEELGTNCFDVFAGDTVFGFVSSWLEKNFTGIELRKEQADFNNERVKAFDLPAKYICDDGRNVLKHIKEKSQDLLFSCPPYYDLEVYSDMENDASNQETYEEFYKILDEAFTNAIKCLKDDRFAVIVAGDVRDKKSGCYYNFIDDIKATFKKNGMGLYNEMILVNPYGTAALRANKNMESRKMVKVHQNVLVFYKGDTKNIKNNFSKIEVPDMKEYINDSEDE